MRPARRAAGVAAAALALLSGGLAASPAAQAVIPQGQGLAAAPMAEPWTGQLTNETVVTGLPQGVVAATSPRDGSQRIFLVQGTGEVRVVNLATRQVQPTPYLDLRSLVAPPGSSDERAGLVGLAFDPRWPAEPYAYVTYRDKNNYLQVYRYRATGNDPQAPTLDPASGTHVLTAGRTPAPYNLFTGGGQLAFGRDGLLYIAVGGRQYGASQDLTTIKGKVLRINVNCGTSIYCIPPGNPFARDTTGKRKEIWAWGVFAPQGLSVDPATGTVWIADKGRGDGQGKTQYEVTARPQGPSGGNLGFPCYDGRARTGVGCATGAAHVMPNFDMTNIPHPSTHVGVQPGLVYRGPQRELQGFYVFGKWEWSYRFSSQFVLTHNPATSGTPRYYTRDYLEPDPAVDNGTNVVSPALDAFAEGDDRELYIVLTDRTLRRVVVQP